MLRIPGAEVARARKESGLFIPVGVPHKGLNTRSPFSAMDPNEAISLNNVVVESYGLRTRKGYTEWAVGFPTSAPIHSVLSYFPATTVVAASASSQLYEDMVGLMMVQPRSNAGPGPGIIFAAQGTSVYNVTAGGVGPWTAELGITGVGPYWNGVNYQNVAGNVYLAANEGGGYAIYNGTTWVMPVAGITPTDIEGLDPTTIVWVTTWKERVWFLAKDSSIAYYLPAGQITGKVTAFEFGTQMDHGGKASWLGGWTVDGGAGTDDYLVCCGSQGDVVIYKGIDPDDATTFSLHGVWYSGPLPVGHRCVEAGGGDIQILTQYGVLPLSKLLQPTHLAATLQQHTSYPIDPLIATLMRDYSTTVGWQAFSLPREELMLIRIPELANTVNTQSFLAYKTTTQTWSVLSRLPYAHTLTTGSAIYAGTLDGRVVRAFDGPLDNVKIGESSGAGIFCRVTPAYHDLGDKGKNKQIKMVRPYFLATIYPEVVFSLLVNYMAPVVVVRPTVPVNVPTAKWSVDKWDVGKWGGLLRPLHQWFGAVGWGHTATVQLDYTTGGDTLLTNIDYWVSQGGVM